MRFYYFLILFILLFSACGPHNFSTSDAQKAIIAGPQDILEKEDIDVVYVTQTGKSTVVAESRIKTAFLLRKIDEEWVVEEIRIGNGQWEKVENLSTALNQVKSEQTRLGLKKISDAVLKYYQETNGLPEFEDYIDLSDILAPKYLDPLIRLDSWRKPLRATVPAPNTILVVSAGPDGLFSTDDDISITIKP
jgi:hypothetical protein